MTITEKKLVDVMIAGAEKSGTTSLASYLSQHPSIVSHRQLEMAYFVRDTEYDLGYNEAIKKYYSDSKAGQIILAKTVDVMYFNATMKRLHQHNPHCKIIVVLRDPVSRAYSAYWHKRSVGLEESETFEEALLNDSKTGINHVNHFYRDRGIYYRQIQSLYDCFGTNQVSVILLDDLIADPDKIMHEILDFVGVDQIKINTSRKSNVAKTTKSKLIPRLLNSSRPIKGVFKAILPYRYILTVRESIEQMNNKSFEVPKIIPQTKRELSEFYKPHNQELEKLLGRSLTHWA